MPGPYLPFHFMTSGALGGTRGQNLINVTVKSFCFEITNLAKAFIFSTNGTMQCCLPTQGFMPQSGARGKKTMTY